MFSPGLRADANLIRLSRSRSNSRDDSDGSRDYGISPTGLSSNSSSPLVSKTRSYSNEDKIEDARVASCRENESVEEEHVDDEIDEDELEEFNPYQFIAYLPEYETVNIVDKICLPPMAESFVRRSLPSLVLDLDETLVHCTVEPIAHPDLIFPVT